MKSSPKLFLSLIPAFVIGMIFQNQLSSSQSESPSAKEKMAVITKAEVDHSANLYIQAGNIGKFQKINGATFSKEEITKIVDNSQGEVYVRIGFDNNVMTLFVGNDQKEYITAEGFCPSNCPYNQN